MTNLKVKTFTFEDDSVFEYNRNYESEIYYRKQRGEYYYRSDTDKIDYNINEFLNNKNINIIDIKINSIVKGNNPPTSILIYTIIYNALERESE